MALRRKNLAKTVQKAVKSLGDIPVKVTYVSCVVGDYDPVTNQRAVVETSYANVTATPASLSKSEADWFPVERYTQKLLIAYNDLPIVISTEDHVIIDGVRWSVKRMKPQTGILHVIFIQEP